MIIHQFQILYICVARSDRSFFLHMLGGKVSFVLNMNECHIVKNKRLERMSITLMNESLAYAKCEPSLLIDDNTVDAQHYGGLVAKHTHSGCRNA